MMNSSLNEARLWFGMWLRNPRHIASLAPSSAALAQLMAKRVPLSLDQPVIELGAGTGAVTRALLYAGVAPANLVVVERDAQLASLLRTRFPGTHVIQGDAVQLQRLLHDRGITSIACVVSSLPLLTLPMRAQIAILRASFTLLDEGGELIQYTYSPFSPIAPRILKRMALSGQRIGHIWRNVPPATVWAFRERS